MAVLLVIYRMYSLFWGGTPSPVAGPALVVSAPAVTSTGAGRSSTAGLGEVRGTAVKVGSSGAQLDPTLNMEAMLVTESLVYTGSGRNIFAAGPAGEAPVRLVAAAFPARPATGLTPPLAPPPATGPPPPPPINLKFFGTVTAADGTRRAFLLNGDDVFLASAGEVVQRRYRVVSIAANSILVEDIPGSNRQTLPLMGN